MTSTNARLRIHKIVAGNGALGGLVVLVVVVVVALSIVAPTFLSAQNLLNVGVQSAVVAVLALGSTFVIVSGGIDLSVGSVAALSAMVGAWSSAEAGLPGPIALPLGLATGVVAGLVNGALVSYGRLPAFIATLAMLSVARGLTLVVSQGTPLTTPDVISFFGSNLGVYLPVPLLIMSVFFGLTALVLTRTYSGRAMYAIGGNPEAARLCGIDVRRQQLVIYALSGLFAAVAGMMLAGRLSSAGPQAAVGYELDAIAAVVIDGASLSGGVGNASGTVIGALVLAVASKIVSDNVAGGRLAAIELGRSTSGAVVHLQGIPGTSASRDRGQGFDKGVNSGTIQVVASQPAGFDRTQGLDVMTNLLQSNPTLTGVFAENDEMALGAIRALGDRAGKDVRVVGFDGTPDALLAIEAGAMAATIAQQPKVLGRIAVEQAVKAARGEQVQQVIDVEVKVVTKQNVAEFK